MNVRATLQAALRDEWDGLERITRDIRAADLFTLLNCLAGITAMMFAVAGRHKIAVGFILLGVLLDGVDGIVARMGKGWGGGPLGPPLDSLADAVTFVAAPAIVVVGTHGSLDAPWWMFLAFALFAASGLLRLARFETIRSPRPNRYFSGLPTPAGAIIVTVPVLLGAVFPWAAASIGAATGILMASRLRYPKLRGVLGAVAGLMVAVVVATYWMPVVQQVAALAILTFMALYLIAGPFYVLTRYGPVQVPA